jgi:predicted MFS family arabinose efflux permease
MALLSGSGHIQPWMVLVLAFAFGIFNAFDLPVRQAALVEMVDDRADLSNAIALNSAEFNVARIIGPAIAGVTLALIGETGCFWVNAVSYIAVLWSLTQMRLPPRAARTGATLGSLREGIAYVMRTESIRNLLVLLAICGGLGFQYNTLLPVYTRTILHANAGVYGALMASFGVGSLVAALSMTRALDRWTLRRNLLIGLTSAGVGLGAFAWSRWLPLTLAMGLVAGYGLILYVASTNTLVQMTTEDHYRGRVMSLYTFMFIGTTPAGALMCGAIAQRAGAPIATSLCALLLLAGAFWVSARLRFLRGQEAAASAAAAPVVAPEKVG